jgi:hypothetical protein
MARTTRRTKTDNPRIHHPTKRGRKPEVRRSRQEAKRELARFR